MCWKVMEERLRVNEDKIEEMEQVQQRVVEQLEL